VVECISSLRDRGDFLVVVIVNEQVGGDN